MAHILDFYFFYGSIHSYLSVMRIGALAPAAGVAVRWQPFNLREILIEQNNTAFTKNEVKMNYFWHDLERRAGCHKIPFAGRAPYPAPRPAAYDRRDYAEPQQQSGGGRHRSRIRNPRANAVQSLDHQHRRPTCLP